MTRSGIVDREWHGRFAPVQSIHYHAVLDREPLRANRQSVPLTPSAALTPRNEARAAVAVWRDYHERHGWTVTGNDDDTLAADPMTNTYQGAAVETCWRNHR